MNKRITSLMLVFTLILTMLATAVPALAAPIESTQLKVTADKTSAKPGDTITYTITMGPVSDMGSMQMCLDIPTGLTYVENSTELTDGLRATLGFDDVAWTEISKMINGVASAADYESNTDTVIAKFQCTVDADFSGTAEVGLTNLEFGSCQTFEYHTDRFSVVKASVTVTVPHTHVYDQTSTDAAHLKTPATCTSPAVYYKSCTCGENGTETFEYGGLGAHNWTPATCTVPKTCSVCQATEGDPLGHTEGNEWKYDSDNHWHTCTVEGCGVVIESSKEAHTPDHPGHATEEYAIKCTKCGYVIEAQLGHTHVFDKEVATDDYKATDATCTAKATYYKSCACGEKGTATFEYGELGAHNWTPATCTVPKTCSVCQATEGDPLGHTEGNEWKYDSDNHWHTCTVEGCGVVIESSKEAHTPDHPGHATEEYAIKCTKCGYVIEAQLGHTHVFDKEVATEAYKASDATCIAKATYYKSCACGEKGTATFEYGELAAHNPASGWTSDASGHWHACQTANCTEKCDFASHTPDHQGHATEEYAIKCTECGYEMEAQLAPSTPVTNIAATVTAPALGQKPDYAPVIVANPADSVDLEEVYWYKIAAADFTGTDEDDWVEMASDETFTTGYYYSVDMYFNPNEGYKMSESAIGTVNGMPHDDTYGELYEGDSAAYLCGLFEPLTVEYTIDLPFSLAVKLTGDEKPAKETFKFEIYDLGVEDAEFEIVKDSVTVENIAFDENGVAFIEGIIKIKVTGEDQLCNLTEGFNVRMVKGSTKGWTYASEQWRIEPFFENDALDLKIAVKEIVDGEISEEYANGMSFAVSYEAVSEPAPTDPAPTDPTKPENPDSPQTGDNSMMGLWIALLFVSGFGVVATTVIGKKRSVR